MKTASAIGIPATLFLLATGTAAQPSGQSLADVLAKPLTQHPGDLYVAPFLGPDNKTTELGLWASSDVASRLAQAPRVKLMPTAATDAALRDLLLAPDAPSGHEVLTAWVGQKAGAVLAATGRVSIRESTLEIEVVLAETREFKVVGKAKIQMPLEERHSQLAAKVAFAMIGDEAGQGGVTYASCTYCARPEYNEEGYRQKVQGVVLMRVLIGADGRIQQMKLVYSLHPSLDRQAFLAVKNWRFRPSLQAGKPVAAWNTVEISFRLHPPKN